VGKTVTSEEINAVFNQYAAGEMKGVLATSEMPLVSSDCVQDPHSSNVNLGSTKVMDGNFAKILSYYDNEWGYSNRLVDLAAKL